MKVLVFDCFGVLVIQRRELLSLSDIWEKHFEKNNELLNFIRENRSNDLKVVVLSNVAQYYFDQIFNKKDQSELFDMISLSGNLGVKKPDKKIFKMTENFIMGKYKLSSLDQMEIILIDDSIQNVNSAKDCGWGAVLYKDFDSFIKSISV